MWFLVSSYVIAQLTFVTGWLGSRVVSVLDSGAERSGFKSQSRRCRVTGYLSLLHGCD